MCTNPSARLLAHYESEVYGYPTPHIPSREAVAEKLGLIAPILKEKLFPTGGGFESGARYIPNNLFLPIDDPYFKLLPMGCELRQLIVLVRNKVLVSEVLWNLLSFTEQETAWLQADLRRILVDYNGNYAPADAARAFAQTIASYSGMLEGIMGLPQRMNYWPSLKFYLVVNYLPAFSVSFSPKTLNWSTAGDWTLETNLGILTRGYEDASVTFSEGKMLNREFPRKARRPPSYQEHGLAAPRRTRTT